MPAIPAIGNVLTPPGFLLFSCQNQVLLSWDPTPLATIFYVNRSVDNVTFTNIASTASLTYADTTGVVGTLYYYQVQAGNGTNSSPATLSLLGKSLNPGQTTVGNIRLQAQQRSNKENSSFITNQEWNSMINESFKELYDILIQKFGSDYYMQTPYTYTLDGVTLLYPLPADFYKLLGGDLSLNASDPNSWVTMKRFNFINRNQWNYASIFTYGWRTTLGYRLNGNNLQIAAPAQSGQTIRIWYAPRPSQLINDTDTIDAVSGWEEYIVVDCCIKALAKEESDVTIFQNQKAALLKRIEDAAENRDAGEPQTVSDIKRLDPSWGYGGVCDGDGGWY